MRYYQFILFFNLVMAVILIGLSVIFRDSDFWIVGMLLVFMNGMYIAIMDRFDMLVKAI